MTRHLAVGSPALPHRPCGLYLNSTSRRCRRRHIPASQPAAQTATAGTQQDAAALPPHVAAQAPPQPPGPAPEAASTDDYNRQMREMLRLRRQTTRDQLRTAREQAVVAAGVASWADPAAPAKGHTSTANAMAAIGLPGAAPPTAGATAPNSAAGPVSTPGREPAALPPGASVRPRSAAAGTSSGPAHAPARLSNVMDAAAGAVAAAALPTPAAGSTAPPAPVVGVSMPAAQVPGSVPAAAPAQSVVAANVARPPSQTQTHQPRQPPSPSLQQQLAPSQPQMGPRGPPAAPNHAYPQSYPAAATAAATAAGFTGPQQQQPHQPWVQLPQRQLYAQPHSQPNPPPYSQTAAHAAPRGSSPTPLPTGPAVAPPTPSHHQPPLPASDPARGQRLPTAVNLAARPAGQPAPPSQMAPPSARMQPTPGPAGSDQQQLQQQLLLGPSQPAAAGPAPNPAAAAVQPPRVRRARAPPAPALPTLLPGLKPPSKGALTSEPASARASGSDSDGGEAVTVRSTRKAKAKFVEPRQPPGRYDFRATTPSSPAGSNTSPYPYNSAYGQGSSPGSAPRPSPPWTQQPPGPALVPIAPKDPLSANPLLSPSPVTGPRPQTGPAPPPPGVQLRGASPSTAPGPGPLAAASVAGPGADVATGGGAKEQASVQTEPGPGTAAAAVPKKKPARPTALWLSSFVHAGRMGAGPGSLELDSAPAEAKRPAVDAGVVAAAMVREAASRPARELSAAVTDMPVSIPDLQARLEAAVQAEQESELRALRALYASGSLRRLQREGVVLVGLAAAQEGRMYRSVLWRFSILRPAGAGSAAAGRGAGGGGSGSVPLPYHKFRAGASVIITRHTEAEGRGAGAGGREGRCMESVDPDTGLPMDGVEGVVVESHKDSLVVALEGRGHETFQAMVSAAASLSQPGATGKGQRAADAPASSSFLGWRLDQSVRDTTTRRHLEGIRRLGIWTEAGENRLGEARVRTVLAGSRSAALLAAEAPEWVKEGRWREDARAVLAAQQGLNDSQRRAVAAALTRTVTLWQGPPGTGKTRTLLALIEVLVRVRAAGDNTAPGPRGKVPRGAAPSTVAAVPSRVEAMGPVLAVADTNAAVDNLVEGLAARGVAVVRLGPAAKARESLRHLSLEAQAEATPAGRRAVALRAAAVKKQEAWRELQEARSSGASGPRSSGPRLASVDAAATMGAAADAASARADLEKAETVLREAACSVVAAAEVVVATCTAAGDSVLDSRPWRCVVVDEASQATEPSVLVALTRGAAFVVMAGDPRQLPPTILSEEALRHGLDVTLFERVATAGGVMPLLLDTQYRMHPAISAFPSAFFYGGKLRDGVTAADKPVPAGFSWPNPAQPLAVVSVTGGREETSGGMAEVAALAVGQSGAANGSSGSGPVLRPRTGAATSTSGGEAGPKPTSVSGAGPGPGPGPGSSERASYRNPVEALLALAVTQQLLSAGDISSAAILTPYRGQVRLVEALSRQRSLDTAWASAGLEVAISTVDGYQGREADVVVFSAVRANDRGAVGFLSDPRRMNVAITRPRRGLVVLADIDTLTRGSRDWSTYIKWARSQGIVAPDVEVVDVEAALSRMIADSDSDSGYASDGGPTIAVTRPTAGAKAGVGRGAAAAETSAVAAAAAAVPAPAPTGKPNRRRSAAAAAPGTLQAAGEVKEEAEQFRERESSSNVSNSSNSGGGESSKKGRRTRSTRSSSGEVEPVSSGDSAAAASEAQKAPCLTTVMRGSSSPLPAEPAVEGQPVGIRRIPGGRGSKQGRSPASGSAETPQQDVAGTCATASAVERATEPEASSADASVSRGDCSHVCEDGESQDDQARDSTSDGAGYPGSSRRGASSDNSSGGSSKATRRRRGHAAAAAEAAPAVAAASEVLPAAARKKGVHKAAAAAAAADLAAAALDSSEVDEWFGSQLAQGDLAEPAPAAAKRIRVGVKPKSQNPELDV